MQDRLTTSRRLVPLIFTAFLLLPRTPIAFNTGFLANLSSLGVNHVVVIVLENEAYSTIVGNTAQAPYENQLISNYALLGDYFSPEHPSLPNYLDLVAGSNKGITTDCPPSSTCQVTGSGASIADLLHSAGLSWKEYAESMPSPCYLSNSGNYAVRHNPFAYFTDITGTSAYCNSHVVPFEDASVGFLADLTGSRLPNYAFVSPNLCNDGHDLCSGFTSNVQEADAWLSITLPHIIAAPQFGSTVVFIVYDEGATSPSSQVYAIAVSPLVKPGFTSGTFYTHYSLLATVEAIFGLGALGPNDATATTMADIFVSPSTVPEFPFPYGLPIVFALGVFVLVLMRMIGRLRARHPFPGFESRTVATREEGPARFFR